MAASIFDLQAELCQAMSNASRLLIVHTLRQDVQCVADIARLAGLTPAKTSQHLAILRRHNIVIAQRQGGRIVYRLANPKIARVCDLMREILTDQAAEITKVLDLIGEAV